jgi:hypothetical protein
MGGREGFGLDSCGGKESNELGHRRIIVMASVRYVYWQEDDAWLGYLEEYRDYWTQGETLEDLLEHLRDLYLDLSTGKNELCFGKTGEVQ